MRIANFLVSLFFTTAMSNSEKSENEVNGGTFKDLFTHEESEFHSATYEQLKLDIEEQFPQLRENVSTLMKRVEKRLNKHMAILSEKGNGVIPITSYDKIKNNNGRLPEGLAEKVRKRGVLIVRNTIPNSEVEEMMGELLKYMYDNKVFPTFNQSIYEIYWSKPQMKARQHPNMLTVQRALLSLWHEDDDNDEEIVDIDLKNPSMYIDRLRIRPPGDSKFFLPPHIDGGGIERWKDPNYRMVYRKILEGKFEEFDPFETNFRVKAKMNDFGYSNGCTFFRAFQGWLALTNSGPGMGTLKVLPLLRESTAYWMLRPFLEDVSRDFFPGCFPGKTFHISNRWHPIIHDQLISVPEVYPGDTVWWHADLVHNVESHHKGKKQSSVFYIPAGPDCAINRDYLRRMRHSFVVGRTPPDFPVNDYEVDFRDRATVNEVTAIGRKMMGFPEQNSEASPAESQYGECPRN